MSFARSKAKIYAEDDVKVTFADVAGVDEAEDELKEIVEFLQEPRRSTRASAAASRRACCSSGRRAPARRCWRGPSPARPACRSSASADPSSSRCSSASARPACATCSRRPRRRRRASCSSTSSTRWARCACRARWASHEEREQTLNQLLAEMDGFDPRKGVIIMAATNRPEVLDPALLRPGRFDRQVLVDKPDVRGREAILRIHARSVKLAPDVDLKVVAARTAGFAGADLANLVNEAALLAARQATRPRSTCATSTRRSTASSPGWRRSA